MLSLIVIPTLGTPIFFLFGTIIGSFGNVLLYRIPRGETLGGRSRCPHCARTLTALELIPVVSYAVLRGHCYGCRAAISPRYPFVEVASGALFMLALWLADFHVLFAVTLGIALWLLFLAAMMDAETGLVSDTLTIPLIIMSVLVALFHDSFSLLPPMVGGGFFLLQWIVTRGRGVGTADILIGTAIGFLLPSLPLLLLALVAAYITGGIAAVAFILSKRKSYGGHLAFVPFLALGTLLALVWGNQLLLLYRVGV